MQEDLLKSLIEVGLEPKEAEIYLAILHLGKATIADVARKSKIKRMTVYQYIDGLVHKNLLHKTVQGKRVIYVAEDPEKIIKILERRKKHFEKFLPDLKSIYSHASHKPRIRFYEGIEGLREIYDEMTKTSQIVYGAFSQDKYEQVFNQADTDKFYENLKEGGGMIKDLVENTENGRQNVKELGVRKGLRQAKLLPKDFSLSVDLLVAGNKVAMMSFINLIGIVIENPEIADLQRNFIKFMRKNI